VEDNKASQEAEHGEDSGRQRHVPVLLEEAIHFLNVRRGGTYIDATLGLGGHSYELAKRLGPQGHLIGFDKDPKALELAERVAANAPLTNFAVLQALPMIAEANPQTGLLMESLMATVAQSDKEAKRRIRAFLDHKTAKVKPT